MKRIKGKKPLCLDKLNGSCKGFLILQYLLGRVIKHEMNVVIYNCKLLTRQSTRKVWSRSEAIT